MISWLLEAQIESSSEICSNLDRMQEGQLKDQPPQIQRFAFGRLGMQHQKDSYYISTSLHVSSEGIQLFALLSLEVLNGKLFMVIAQGRQSFLPMALSNLTPELTRPAHEAFNIMAKSNDESHAIAGSG
jgi:hypothetical protein